MKALTEQLDQSVDWLRHGDSAGDRALADGRVDNSSLAASLPLVSGGTGCIHLL